MSGKGPGGGFPLDTGLEPSPLSLQQLCREEVRDRLDRSGKSVDKLWLPTKIKKYIKYEE